MVEVLKVQDESQRRACFVRLGLTDTQNVLLFAAHEAGEMIGVCAYRLNLHQAQLLKLWVHDDSDMLLKQLCIRAVLNAIDLNGVKKVYAPWSAFDEILMRSLRFEPGSGEEGQPCWTIDLTGYFDAACESEYKTN